jgi:hypothetical protein
MHDFLEWLWKPSTVDGAVFATLCGLIITSLCWIVAPCIVRAFLSIARRLPPHALPHRLLRPDRAGSQVLHTRKTKSGLVAFAVALITISPLYIAYATFRTSNMMSALQYISDQANNVSRIETDEPVVLCIYRWGEQKREEANEGCGDNIFVSDDGAKLSDKFNLIQIYIEESILFAAESKVYRRRYGANFFQGLGYWMSDLSEDWTGAVSFYIISREINDATERGRRSTSTSSLQCLNQHTGIEIKQVCKKYGDFVTQLGPAGRPFKTEVACQEPKTWVPERPNSPVCDDSWWARNFFAPTLD